MLLAPDSRKAKVQCQNLLQNLVTQLSSSATYEATPEKKFEKFYCVWGKPWYAVSKGRLLRPVGKVSQQLSMQKYNVTKRGEPINIKPIAYLH